jgi:hypothetical protein
MSQCDGPKCKVIGVPENDKPHRPPYSWLQVTTYSAALGTLVKEFCSGDCASKFFALSNDEWAEVWGL